MCCVFKAQSIAPTLKAPFLAVEMFIFFQHIGIFTGRLYSVQYLSSDGIRSLPAKLRCGTSSGEVFSSYFNQLVVEDCDNGSVGDNCVSLQGADAGRRSIKAFDLQENRSHVWTVKGIPLHQKMKHTAHTQIHVIYLDSTKSATETAPLIMTVPQSIGWWVKGSSQWPRGRKARSPSWTAQGLWGGTP